MGQEFSFDMRHYNASVESLSWITRLDLARKIVDDWRLVGDRLTL